MQGGWFEVVSENLHTAGQAFDNIAGIFGVKPQIGTIEVREIVVCPKSACSAVAGAVMTHSRLFVRVAGLSGAAAVIVGAYGAHGEYH